MLAKLRPFNHIYFNDCRYDLILSSKTTQFAETIQICVVNFIVNAKVVIIRMVDPLRFVILKFSNTHHQISYQVQYNYPLPIHSRI